MSIVKDLGAVSAYALAVKYGYTGTEREWVEEMERKRIEAVNAAEESKKSASSAQSSQTSSAESASSASTSAASALASQNEAKNYFEKTKKMQIASVGNITFSHTEDGLLRASWED